MKIPDYLVSHINPIHTHEGGWCTRDLQSAEFTIRIEAHSIRPYLTCWIVSGWPGFPEAKKMYQNGEWRNVIANAIGTSVGNIWLGFESGDFDVREF